MLVDRGERTLIVRSASLLGESGRTIIADIGSLDCVLVVGSGTEEHPSGYQLQARLVSGDVVALTRTYSGGIGLASAIAGPPFKARNSIREALGLETVEAGNPGALPRQAQLEQPLCAFAPDCARTSIHELDGRGGRRSYHHGNLREALINAALDLIAQKGPAGFTFAEAARAAGVSPAAPYRHFRDRDALMADVAKRGFEHFEQRWPPPGTRARPSRSRRFERVGARLSRLRARRSRRYFRRCSKSGAAVRRASAICSEAGDRAFDVLREACEAMVADACRRASGRPP